MMDWRQSIRMIIRIQGNTTDYLVFPFLLCTFAVMDFNPDTVMQGGGDFLINMTYETKCVKG